MQATATLPLNGTTPHTPATPTKKVATKKPTVRKVTPRPAKASRPDHLRAYALSGVAVMATLSACLNGYAHSLHATIPAAGWAMGLVIPVIILVLGKVAGLLWKRGQTRLAQVTAGSGVGLLALSVWHCTISIALLTGSPILLALPMAVAVDVGFCCCEAAALSE